MKYYTYDDETKEFLFSGEAELDPVETENQGENIYLLPANSTFDEPLKPKEGFAVVYNDGWEYISDYRGKKYIKDNMVQEIKELGEFQVLTDEQLEKLRIGDLILENGALKEKPLDELKEQKRAEINRARDNAEQGGFEYMGKVFDSDQVSCIRMSSAAQAMSAVAMSGETPTITWTCQDNSTIDLTAPELMGLVVALAQHSNECHQKATALKAQIDTCGSREELDAITWVDIVD